MKQLFNYYPLPEYEKELTDSFGSMQAYLTDSRLDGIELFLPNETALVLKQETVGIHLPYLPFWLDLWHGNMQRLYEQFTTREDCRRYLHGTHDRESWCEYVRSNIKKAVLYEPQYLVWHVSEANREEIFTRNFYYTDEMVIDATAELFHCVADVIPSNVTVLFENLWWQGLRLTDVRMVERLLERIARDNIGIMLDTGHLLNTNPRLRTEEEGADYICRTIEGLGDLATLIRGIHLQCSLSGAYLTEIRPIRPAMLSLEEEGKYIMAIDQHKPFGTSAMKRVIDCVCPEWLVHELYYNNLVQMQMMLRQERTLLDLI